MAAYGLVVGAHLNSLIRLRWSTVTYNVNTT